MRCMQREETKQREYVVIGGMQKYWEKYKKETEDKNR